ncbi:MAG: ComEC/Rec2 family competence protein [Huintestinicola sp.]|uniref:ComEC/Rec2 family competence protein n=1 Tax=Huintestinicola sp. TaxID=2981661 RepID=UPI003F0F5C6D
MTRKAAVFGLGYLSGLLLASFLALWLSGIAGGVLLCFGASVMFIVRPEKSGRFFAFSAAAFSCGAGMILYSGYDAFVYRDIVSRSGMTFEGSAIIKDVRVYSEDSAFCTARVEFPDGKKADIGWYSDDSDVVRGDRAYLCGTLYAPENTDFFNSADYYRSRNIFLLLDTDTEEYFPKEHNILRTLRDIRQNAAQIIRRYVPSDEGELLIGMIFGSDEWNISSEAEKCLYRSGVGHIASVSGMHMAVAAGIASAAAAALSMTKRGKLLLVTAVCLVFTLAADMGVSVSRAFIMTMLVYSAELFKRQSDPLSSLSIAAFILTAGTPFIVRSPSFMLSFSGVFGAAVLAPFVTENVKKAYENRFGRKMGEGAGLTGSVLTAVCASAAVIPASMLCLDRLSVVSPITNLLLSPFFTAAMMIAMTGAVLTLLPFSWLSGGLFLASGAICRPVLWAAEKIGSLSFAALPSGTEIAPPIIGLVIVSAGVSALVMKNRSAAILTVSAAVFSGAAAITVYRAVPYEYTRIALLTEGKGCVLIISEGQYSQIFDFMGNKSSVRAAERYISRNDTGTVGMVFLSRNPEYSAPLYKKAFPNAQIVSRDENIGLTYETEGNIIKFGGVTCRPYKEYSIIEAGGAEIICIDRKCAPPDKSFDMCICNCTADVPVQADIYAVTNKNYKGLLPADEIIIKGGGEFAAHGGEIYVREDRKWLR